MLCTLHHDFRSISHHKILAGRMNLESSQNEGRRGAER